MWAGSVSFLAIDEHVGKSVTLLGCYHGEVMDNE